MPARSGVARTSSERIRGFLREISTYVDILGEEVANSSLQGGEKGVAKSSSLNHDVEPKIADGDPSK